MGRTRGPRYLVGADFSGHSREALRNVRALIRKSGGEATLVHVRPSSDIRAAVDEDRGDLLGLAPSRLRRELAGHYRRKLREAARALPGASTRLLRGRPAERLCGHAAKGYDVLVLGGRGRGAVARALLGSTVQYALRHSPIPVVVVPAR